MSIQLVTEILAAHADQLNRGQAPQMTEWLAALPAGQEEVASLLSIATRLKRALQPAAITPEFRAHLRDGLTMAAEHKVSQKILIERRDPAWGWVLGAAALGSAAGLIAIAWRARGQRQPVTPLAHESSNPN